MKRIITILLILSTTLLFGQYRWKIIDTSNGLLDNYVYDINSDTFGRILIATAKGLSVINKDFTFDKLQNVDTLKTDDINCISVYDSIVADYTLFIGSGNTSTNGGIGQLDRNLNILGFISGYNTVVRDITPLFGDTFFAATDNGLYDILSGKIFLISNFKIYSLLVNYSNQTLYSFTDAGVLSIKNDTFSYFYTTKSGLNLKHDTTEIADNTIADNLPNDNLIGYYTYSSGNYFFLYDSYVIFQNVSTAYRLTPVYMTGLSFSKVWAGVIHDTMLVLGTGGDGVYGISITDSSYFHYNQSNSDLPANNVTQVLSDNNQLWFLTHNGIANKNGNEWIIYNKQTGLSSDILRSAHIDRNNNIWFGTTNGGVNVLLREDSKYEPTLEITSEKPNIIFANDIDVTINSKHLFFYPSELNYFSKIDVSAYSSETYKNNYSFSNLSSGHHTITFKVSDIYDNADSAELSFYLLNGDTSFSTITNGNISVKIFRKPPDNIYFTQKYNEDLNSTFGSDITFSGIAVSIKPYNQFFDYPIELIFNCTQTISKDYAIYNYDIFSAQWKPVGGAYNKDNKTISTIINQSGIYAVMKMSDPDNTLFTNDLIMTCLPKLWNINKTDKLSIVFEQNVNSAVTIDIFSAEGQKITNIINSQNFDAGIHTIKYDIAGTDDELNNGPYIILIKNDKGFSYKRLIYVIR